MNGTSTTIETIDRLIGDERHDAARAAIADALEAADRPTRWRLALRRAELGAPADDEDEDGEALDEALLAADDLLARAERHAPEEGRVRAVLVRGWATKRCVELAAAAGAATGAVAACPHLLVARGDAALYHDDRQGAGALYREALAKDPASADARLALANLHYVLGDFAACEAELDHVPREAACWGSGARLRAACRATLGDAAGEAAAWRSAIEAYPEGDRRADDRMALAAALAMDGRRPEAFEAYRAVWQAEPDSPRGRYARRRMELIEAAPASAAHKRLPAFPTTKQKWNTCGPAVLELCLRHLGLELSQDEIASVVMRGDHGTPMYALAGYLAALRIDARRVEATPERLRAAIDLGLPVIVQEEYSTTSHVAVIVGYDEALGVFVSQDPATHRPLLKSFEFTRSAGDLFGNGGLIVLGREGAQGLAELQARVTAAGLVQAPHLELLDACDRRRPGALGGSTEGDEADGVADAEVVRLCDEALALSPEFKLAHHRRFGALVNEDPRRALEALHRIRTTFAADEWPHRLHGIWLLRVCERHDEAFAELAEAARRDPGAAHTRADMGECMWLAGDLARAERELLAALAGEPHHVRAAENLAAVYLRQLEELDLRPAAEEDDEDEDDELPDDPEEAPGAATKAAGDEEEPPGTTMPPDRLRSWIDRPRPELLRRALHFSKVACAVHPENPFNHGVEAELHVRRGDWESAAAAYRRSRERDPGRPMTAWGLADVLEKLERHDEAEALLQEVLEAFPEAPPSYERAARFLGRRGRHEEAASVLVRGVERLEDERAALVPSLVRAFDALAPGAPRSSAAARRLAEVAQRWPADPELARAVTTSLEERGWRDEAVAVLREAVDATPHDLGLLNWLGLLLSQAPRTRKEGRALLQRLVELAPFAAPPRYTLAWLALEDGDPAAGLALLEELSEADADAQEPRLHETRSALLEALGRDEEAAAAFQAALEAESSPEVGLLRLAAWHRDARRPGRVYELIGRVGALELEGPLAGWWATQWEDELEDLEEILGLFAKQPPRQAAVRQAWAGSLLGELWTLLGDPAGGLAEHDLAILGHEALEANGPVCRRALADALGKRVEALRALGRPQQALRDLTRAAQLYAQDPERRAGLAELHVERSHALRALGDEAAANRALDEACAACEAPGALDPEAAGELRDARATALLERARVRARTTERAAAEADARAALALLEAAATDEPDRAAEVAGAALVLGTLLTDRLALAEAEALLRSVAGRLAGAEGADEEALAQARSDVGLRLAYVLIDAGRTVEARDTCQGLIATLEAADEPDPAMLAAVHHTAGLIALDLLSDVPGAVEAYSKALELGGESLGTYSNRGYSYLRGYLPERALTDGDRVLKRVAERQAQGGRRRARLDEAYALRNVAMAHELLDDLPAAREACAQALEIFRTGGERDQMKGHIAEMQAVEGRLLLAGGDVARAVAVTDEALAAQTDIVERGHGVGEMDLVKVLLASGAARHAAGDRDGAHAVLARAEALTAKWVAQGGAFQDVLADVAVRQARLLVEAGRAQEAVAAATAGLAAIGDAIEGGHDHMLPELLRLAAEWIAAHPPHAGPTLERVGAALAATATDVDDAARSVLPARRARRLLGVIGAHAPPAPVVAALERLARR